MKGQQGFIGTLQSTGASTERRKNVWRAVVRQVQRWIELSRQRRQLAMLDDYQLKDIGLSRADIMTEVERPFWDDPSSDDPIPDNRPRRAAVATTRSLR